jgi:hypothetical protein
MAAPTQPSSQPKGGRSGRPNRPKKTYEVQYPFANAPEYPITDEFASREIPTFGARRAKDHPKTGWNCVPTRAPIGGFATIESPPSVTRGTGKEIRRREAGTSAATYLRNKKLQPGDRIEKEG